MKIKRANLSLYITLIMLAMLLIAMLFERKKIKLILSRHAAPYIKKVKETKPYKALKSRLKKNLESAKQVIRAICGYRKV